MKGAAPIIKKQLIAFGVVSLLATILLAVTFLRVPEQLGVNRSSVSADFAQGAGIYEGAEVTYLGHPIGKVGSVEIRGKGLRADLRIKADVEVPAGVTAEIHSRSAVGEQYVELVPPADPGEDLLADGAVIPQERTSYPVEIGPVLDNVQALVASIDEQDLAGLVDETGRALQGRSGDLQAILDSGSSLIEVADANFEPTADLLRDLGPVLSTVNGEGAGIVRLTRNLAQVTAELRAGDGDLRSLLASGPGFTTQTVALLDDLSVSLPVLLRRTNPVINTLAVYDAHLEQLLSDYPLATATVQSVTLPHLDTHEVRLTLANADKPPACVKGFVPAKDWTSVYGQAPAKTPLVYCQAPKDDPRGVRGARNIPCPQDPARREGDASKC